MTIPLLFAALVTLGTAPESPTAAEEDRPEAADPAPSSRSTDATESPGAPVPDPEAGLSVRERALRRSTRINRTPLPWDLIGLGAVAAGGTAGSVLFYQAAFSDHVLLQQGAAWGRGEAEAVARRGQLRLLGAIGCGALAAGALSYGIWRLLSPGRGATVAVMPTEYGPFVMAAGRF